MNAKAKARGGADRTPPVRWILASGSPRRSELLRMLGWSFEVRVPDVPEIAPGHLVPREICIANATAKARAVSRHFPDAWVLGADTEVALGTRVFGKPRDLREAAAFLGALAGRPHEVITGVCLMHAATGRRRAFAEVTRVTFHPLTRAQIAAYLAQVNPLDKAGAYAVQERGETIIESIEGSLTNVVGLPLGALRKAQKSLGLSR